MDPRGHEIPRGTRTRRGRGLLSWALSLWRPLSLRLYFIYWLYFTSFSGHTTVLGFFLPTATPGVYITQINGKTQVTSYSPIFRKETLVGLVLASRVASGRTHIGWRRKSCMIPPKKSLNPHCWAFAHTVPFHWMPFLCCHMAKFY